MREFTCIKCLESKTEDNFYPSFRKQNYFICKECNLKQAKIRHVNGGKEKREAARRRRRDNKREYIYNILLTNPCVDCGEEDFRVLEFDHVKEKSNRIQYYIEKCSLERLQEELDKCEVVCANCHRRRTFSREYSWRHLRFEETRR